MELTWTYEAVGSDGAVLKGVQAAADIDQLMHELARRGLTPIKQPKARAKGSKAPRSGGKMRPAEVAELAGFVALTSRAGLSVVDSIEDFCEDRPPQVKALLQKVVDDVRNGNTLGDAFGAHEHVFGRTFLAMVRAGEQSGSLEEAMEGAARQISFQVEVKGKLKQAMVQPAILLTCVVGLIILLLTYLMPRILGMILEAGVELPASTALLMKISDFLQAHWLGLLLGLGTFIAAFKYTLSKPKGRRAVDAVILAMPVVGGIAKLSAEARFVSTMSTLMGSGVDAVRSLRMAADTTGSAQLCARLNAAADRVSEGDTLTEAVTAETDLHPLVRRMIQLGETAGALHETLGSAVGFLSAELPRRVHRAVSFVEPIIIVISGLLVAFILLSALLPVFSLYESY